MKVHNRSVLAAGSALALALLGFGGPVPARVRNRGAAIVAANQTKAKKHSDAEQKGTPKKSLGAADADAALVRGLASGNSARVGALLDSRFTWTDSAGKTRSKSQALTSLRKMAASAAGEKDLAAYNYGQLEAITGSTAKTRFLRVWIERPAGWRGYAIVETPIGSGTAPFSTPASAAADCENPCREIPYKPPTAADREMVAILERLKMDEWHPNPEDWAPYVLDGVDYVTSAGPLSKQARVAHLAAEKASGAAIIPGDPVIRMHIDDFGDAAAMVSTNRPFLGGKPYYSLRIWTLRNGRWLLANSQQTVIQGAKPLPAITMGK